MSRDDINTIPDSYYKSVYQDREQMYRHAPFALEEMLIRAVTSGDSEGALIALSKIENSAEKAILADEPLRSAKNSVICSIVFLTRATIRAGVNSDEAFAMSDAAIRHIETLKEKNSVLEYEKDSVLQFVSLVNRSAASNYSAPAGRAVQYIESRLEKKLSLKEIAQYSQVHPNYLSEIFKKELGYGIAEYINRRKVQESVYFVKNRAYRLSDIAYLYGFSSQSYFGVVFKRIMGVSPKEYRKTAL